MSFLLLLMLVATTPVPLQGARNFTSYASRSNWSVPSPEVERVGKMCGLSFEGAAVVYGTKYGNHWVHSTGLRHAWDKAETDLYQTVEIWRNRDGQEAFALWSISADTGDQYEVMGCLSQQGALRTVVITNMRTTPEDGHLEFRHNTEAEFDGGGRQIHRVSGFITYQGLPATTPKVDAENRRALAGPIDPKGIAQDIRAIEMKIRKVHAA